MKPDITVAEVRDKEVELIKNIQKLIEDFNNSTGFYVEDIDLYYHNTIGEFKARVCVDIVSRINR